MPLKRNHLKSIFSKLTALLLAIAVLFLLPITVSASENIKISADAAMLINMNCGKVLFSKNENKIMYPASITKLMTAIIAAENISNLEGTYIKYSSTADRLLKNTGLLFMDLKLVKE